jgi:hypothetical protein
MAVNLDQSLFSERARRVVIDYVWPLLRDPIADYCGDAAFMFDPPEQPQLPAVWIFVFEIRQVDPLNLHWSVIVCVRGVWFMVFVFRAEHPELMSAPCQRATNIPDIYSRPAAIIRRIGLRDEQYAKFKHQTESLSLADVLQWPVSHADNLSEGILMNGYHVCIFLSSGSLNLGLILFSRCLILAEIARGFETVVEFVHNLKRVFRYVDNERITQQRSKEVVATRIIHQLERRLRLKPGQALEVIIDWT